MTKRYQIVKVIEPYSSLPLDRVYNSLEEVQKDYERLKKTSNSIIWYYYEEIKI